MKFIIFFFTFLFLGGCVSYADSVSENSKTTQPSPTIESLSTNSNTQDSYTTYQINSALLDKLTGENERFKIVPTEFETVDFKNFKYDFGRLKDGKYEVREPNNPLAGSLGYTFNNVFYVDLIGDNNMEAIVFLYQVGCGASCNGGADVVYFYSSNNGNAKLLDIFETGPKSGGCSLKSFTLKDKKIYIEQFGNCLKNSTYDEREIFPCKFCTKDETHSVYSFSNSKLRRESSNVIETRMLDVMNSPAYISIDN
jgi:hypothetical protein